MSEPGDPDHVLPRPVVMQLLGAGRDLDTLEPARQSRDRQPLPRPPRRANGRGRDPSAESLPNACHERGLQGMRSPHRLQRHVSSESPAPTTIDRASMRSSGRRHRGCRWASSPADVLTRTPSTLRSSSIRRCCFPGSRDMFVPAQRRILPPATHRRRAAGTLWARYRALGASAVDAADCPVGGGPTRGRTVKLTTSHRRTAPPCRRQP